METILITYSFTQWLVFTGYLMTAAGFIQSCMQWALEIDGE